ncbi:LruC domain-containing protein [Leptospira sp. 96542]|nr:LruC domain-containing protein [Leptospira sp. 96542]
MQKWILIFIIPFLLLDCSNKKKGAFLLPLLGLGGETTEGATETDGFTVTGLGDADPGQVAAGTEEPAPTTVNTGTTTVVVDQTNPDGGFNFETTITVPVTVVVNNENGPVADAQVTITETTTTGDPNVIGQGTTDSNGSATVEVTVPPTVEEVQVSIIGVNPTTGEVEEITGSAPVQQPSPNTGDSGTGGTVIVAPTIVVDSTNFQPVNGCVQSIDSDCDGVANVYDEFPDDPTLSSVARSGRYTIAFEDLYPDAGDADLNDHSTVFSTEMEKTPANKVKTIRGTYTHVAKGAGYNHELRVSLDVPTSATVEVSYLDGQGNVWDGCTSATKYTSGAFGDCVGGSFTQAQLKTGVLILPSSDKTLFGKKNAPKAGESFGASDFTRGVTAQITIQFEDAVDLSATKNIVGGHLNYFVAINQKTDGVYRQIFRPGFYKDANGKDKFLDKNGFPWAIVVPGIFNHPTEGDDIRKPASSGYIFFNAWMNSNGVAHKDWYEHMDLIPAANKPSRVVRVRDFYTENGFSAYILKAVRTNVLEVAGSLIVVGALLGFAMKKRFGQTKPVV